MDVVVIGKASYGLGDKPQVVYCGQDRNEAQKAVNASNLVRFYEIDAHRIVKPVIKLAAPKPTEKESPKSKAK